MSGSYPAMADLPEMQAWATNLMNSRPRDFAIGGDESPYILRWWVIPRNPWCNLYLHSILRSDDDRALHDHPWGNTSLLLFGGYIEHTPEGAIERKAGDVISRPADALHRLEVIPGRRAISLFATGPKVREWGFACGHGWVHWRDFTSDDGAHVGRGCGEHDDLTPVSPVGSALPTPTTLSSTPAPADIANLIHGSMGKDFERVETIDGFETGNTVAPNAAPKAMELLKRVRPYIDAADAGIDTPRERCALRDDLDTFLSRQTEKGE